MTHRMRWVCGATAMILLFGSAAHAQQSGDQAGQAKTINPSQQQAIEPVTAGNAPIVLAEAIRGMIVIGVDGSRLGTLEEVAVSLGGRSVGYGLVMPAVANAGMKAVPLGALLLAENPGISVEEGRGAEERFFVERDDLIGQDVLNSRGNEIAEVEDVVLRRGEEGPLVVMDVGGFLGIGEKQVALPIADFSLFGESLVLATDMTSEDLEAAPEFDPSEGEPVDPSQTIASLRRLERGEAAMDQQQHTGAIDLAGKVLAIRMTTDQFASAPTLQSTSGAWQGDPDFEKEVTDFYGTMGQSGAKTQSGDQDTEQPGGQNN